MFKQTDPGRITGQACTVHLTSNSELSNENIDVDLDEHCNSKRKSNKRWSRLSSGTIGLLYLVQISGDRGSRIEGYWRL